MYSKYYERSDALMYELTLDAAGFEQAAQKAEQLCLVSNALRTNVAIRL
ncbi:hypothetical protein [Ktedonospora formicarum]|uniref:Uncharacterized protein n=1 Tax=Ktedonospora formicarum TaxID=2778364 RepID=A0A8J3MU15_9CHLR|nr:hypothetical protein [Ktedonospora formicarum]GHO47740.1 hypothetical protein KSX_59030 [Ktedonospora formicarum]